MQIKESNPNPPKMNYMKTFLSLFFFIPFAALSQTTYLPFGDKQYILLERLEIKAQKDSILNFSKTKPFSRKTITPIIEAYNKTSSLVESYGEIPPSVTPEEYKKLYLNAQCEELFNEQFRMDNR
jgi:hypothetical protein